jgi:hypothetical protein
MERTLPTNLQELVNTLQDSTYEDPIALLKSLVTNTNVHVEKIDGKPVRAMLSFNKHKQPANQLQCQSNGIIIEVGTWKVLSIPSKVLLYKYDGAIMKQLHQFTAYYALDGTCVTLYWYGGAWCMASANGYDVRTYTRLTSITYWDALLAALTKAGISVESLDKNISYNFGFRNSEFHPLRDLRSPTLWLISAYDLTTYKELNLQLGIPKQPQVKSISVKYINNLNKNALRTYLTNGTAHYGFILRNATGSYLLESNLMKSIRTMVYDQPKDFVAEYSKPLWLAMRAYLKPSTNKLYIDLFPQFTSLYKQITEFFNRLIVCVISADSEENEPLDCLARQIRNVLSSRFDVADHNNYKIIYDSVLCEENLDLYMSAMALTSS